MGHARFSVRINQIKSNQINVVAYLKTHDDSNIKLVATECGAPNPRVYHHYHGRISHYDRNGPN